MCKTHIHRNITFAASPDAAPVFLGSRAQNESFQASERFHCCLIR